MAAGDALIEVDGNELHVYFDYDEQLIEALKRLPRRSRRWSRPRHCWIVDKRLLADVTRILKAAGLDVDVIHRIRTPPPKPKPKPDSTPPAHPRRVTRDCLVELFGAYKADPSRLIRALSFGFHPDHGGDPELQRLVNEIAAELKLRRVP